MGDCSDMPRRRTAKNVRCIQPRYSTCWEAIVATWAGISVRWRPPTIRTRANARLMAKPRPQEPIAVTVLWMRVMFRSVDISRIPSPSCPIIYPRMSFSTSSAVGRVLVPSLDFKRWIVTPLSSISAGLLGLVRRIGT